MNLLLVYMEKTIIMERPSMQPTLIESRGEVARVVR